MAYALRLKMLFCDVSLCELGSPRVLDLDSKTILTNKPDSASSAALDSRTLPVVSFAPRLVLIGGSPDEKLFLTWTGLPIPLGHGLAEDTQTGLETP